VVIGGGANHRYSLYDMIMIKDNHIDISGGIDEAIIAAQNYLKKKLPIEVESRNIEDVKKILLHKGIQRIMLDNYTTEQTLAAVKLIAGKVETESSGGITESTISIYAKTGVDFINWHFNTPYQKFGFKSKNHQIAFFSKLL
jgi:nicotinate-nucleotide pyrophosphorylase (carboxylating)